MYKRQGSKGGCWGFFVSSSLWKLSFKGISLFFGGSTKIVTVRISDSEKDGEIVPDKINNEKRNEMLHNSIR